MNAPPVIAVVREWGARLVGTFTGRRDDADLAEELSIHEELAREAAGRSSDGLEGARRHVALRAGGTTQVMEALRDQRGFRWLDDFVRDVRHAGRLLRRHPGLALAAVSILALCIGANAVVFSAVDALLLRPLPFDDAAGLYAIKSTYQGALRAHSSFADFHDWRAQSDAFRGMTAIMGDGVSLTTPNGPEYLIADAVSEDFFAVFRVQPALGRPFLSAEYRPGHGQVVILSHRLWLRDFAGDPGVVGRTVVLDEQPQTIVGVMPAGMAFPPDAEVWRPLTLVATDADRRADLLKVVGRLRPGVTEREAQVEMAMIGARLARQHPSTNARWGVAVVSLQVVTTERARPTLLALWGAVTCLLVIGCANVGVLLLARFIRRGPELAIRTALGAGRGRLIRQLLSESLLLACAAGCASLLVAKWARFALDAVVSGQPMRVRDIPVDGRALLFTAALSIAAGLLVGILPVWRVARGNRHASLAAGAVSMPDAAQHRLLRLLAMGQVAVSIVLVISAVLMVRTVERLQAVPLGFVADHLLTFYISLPTAHYDDDARIRSFYSRLLDRVRGLPGVRGVSAINALYINWADAIVVPVRIEGRPPPKASQPADTHVRIVDPSLHQLLRIPVLRGRSFTSDDGPDAPPRAVINEAMAQRDFPGEDPIGHHISVAGRRGRPVWEEIVGVVGDVRQHGLDAEVSPEIELPDTQSLTSTMAILVRTASEPLELVGPIRSQVERLDPDLPLLSVQTMEDVLATSMANRRGALRLLSAFAALALILTAIGVAGVVVTGLGERTREIAVRIALGARPSRVVWGAVAKMMTATSAAIAAGLAIALAATGPIRPLLYGIASTDPVTYAVTAASLFLVAAGASWLAARRLLRLDLMAILRME